MSNIIKAISAEEMFAAVMKESRRSNHFYRRGGSLRLSSEKCRTAKIKKENKDSLNFELEKTPDILANVSKKRTKDCWSSVLRRKRMMLSVMRDRKCRRKISISSLRTTSRKKARDLILTRILQQFSRNSERKSNCL